jgi:hypothetical protein
MAKATKTPIPIMTPDEERFMAFEGLIQWTQAVVTQSARVSAARERQSALGMTSTPVQRRQAIHAFHAECHFFAVAAHKLLEFRDWVLTFGLCASVDFAEIDSFSAQDIRDLRNMWEHVVDYFRGAGNSHNRWIVETPEYKADASSVIGTIIGGRLDWIGLHSRWRLSGYCRNCWRIQSPTRRDSRTPMGYGNGEMSNL